MIEHIKVKHLIFIITLFTKFIIFYLLTSEIQKLEDVSVYSYL